MDTTNARLKARWEARGDGPQLQTKLKALQAELDRRESAARAKARGVDLPETVKKPAEPQLQGMKDLSSAMEALIPEQLKAPDRPREDGDDDEDSDEEEYKDLVDVYKKPPVVLPPDRLAPADPIVRLKNEGNAALKDGDLELALALYTEALSPSDTPGKNRQLSKDLAGVLYSNRSHVNLRLGDADAAAVEGGGAS